LAAGLRYIRRLIAKTEPLEREADWFTAELALDEKLDQLERSYENEHRVCSPQGRHQNYYKLENATASSFVRLSIWQTSLILIQFGISYCPPSK